MKPYKDTAGVWHITTAGRDRPASEVRLAICLRDLEPFTINGGNFLGSAPIARPVTEGLAGGEYLASLANASYVVYSFDIPIAWHVPAVGDMPYYWAVPAIDHRSLPVWRHQRMIINTLSADLVKVR